MIFWALAGLGMALADEPSPEALFEAQTLQLVEAMRGYEVRRGDDALSASQFAGLVGDDRGLVLLDRSRRRQRRTAVSCMAASALLIGAGSWTMGMGLAQDTERAAATDMAVGGGMVLGGLGLYGVTAGVLMGRGPIQERVDRHYSREQASAWMERYHEQLEARLGVEGEAPR